jgi:capsular exopolysaccharide synthesis family protein
MKLNKYIFPLRKWWWLLVGSTLIAVIFSSVSVLRQPTIYQARTTLMIGTTINNPNPSTNELSLGQQLAAAYANLANRELVSDATKKALGLNQLPEYIASAVPNTQLIEIVVNDSDPQRAQTVANELAAQLLLISPMSAQSEERDRQAFVHERLNSLEEQIRQTQAEIEKLQGDLANAFSAQQINDIQAQITSLQAKLGAMENNYGLLLSNSQQGAINTLAIIASADLPTRPIGPMKGLTILLAAAAGLILAACEAYLLEYLDDTLKFPDDVERLFSAPIIGHIFEQGDGNDKVTPLNNADDMGQPIAEAFRGLRTNIEISQASRPLKTILVTSADIGDGKTSVAANLALSLSQREKDVVLLDVDLRRPNIHEFFEMKNDRGLVDLISDTATISDVLEFKKDKRLAILASGGTPVNPTELLGSKKMDQVLSTLEEAADMVIIDGPPLIVADSLVMASKVDGVLLIVRPGHTRYSLAQAAAEQIKMSGARLVGVVLNRIPHNRADVYAGKSHMYSYYMGNYRDERARKDKELDLEKVPELAWAYLSPRATKATDSIKRFFHSVRSRSKTKSPN